MIGDRTAGVRDEGRAGPGLLDSAPPDPELLDHLTVRGLQWLDGMRPCFRLPPDVTTDADPNITLKPLGELAELTHLVRTRHPRGDIREQADALFGFAWDETRGGQVFAELIRGEPQATYPVELYGVFAQAGLRNAEAEKLARATTGLRGWRVAREDHTRTLGVLNAERRIGLPPHADFDAELSLTGLGLLREPWALDRKAAYGITHDVFHLTDWGRAAQRMPAPLADYLRLWVPSWLESWLAEELWDLAGELLAVLACLPPAAGAPPADAAGADAAAWLRLAAAQLPDGAVPEIGAGPPPGHRPHEAFTSCYHSTLVTAFAATLTRVGGTGGGDRRPTAESEAAP
ncbi:DUF6895 family protein [Streptomyces sp. CA-111067]|uniref:DUF6895 family protein n=1 Tax=Streptomyces sp. CA-111067 TaxID=3240046 RepID=UPI003D995E5C